MKRIIHLVLVMAVSLSTVNYAHAQDTAKKSGLVKITGVLIDADEHEEVPFVNIHLKGTVFGTVSDHTGHFSFLVHRGDTVEFSHVGYNTAYFIMPRHLEDDHYNILQLMHSETMELEEVMIFPWPDYEHFKEAFLEIEPEKGMKERSLIASQDIQRVVRQENEKHKYLYDQYRNFKIYELTGEIPANNFLNPIRWSNFLHDLRHGAYKGKKLPERR
ncbi:MAG: carboxypeptidase-like regulatory domain-containing protein [Bacteroidota bacterium]